MFQKADIPTVRRQSKWWRTSLRIQTNLWQPKREAKLWLPYKDDKDINTNFLPIRVFQTVESSSCWKRDTWRIWSKPRKRWAQTKQSMFLSYKIFKYIIIMKLRIIISNFLLISQVGEVSELERLSQKINQDAFNSESIDDRVKDLCSRDLIKILY